MTGLAASAANWGLQASANDVQKGYDIARRGYLSARGFGAYTTQSTMENIDARSRQNSRTMDTALRETANGHQSRFRVTAPAALNGTAVLSHSFNRAGKANDQWIFLADQRRVRRLVSSRRTGSFLGSELSYEDLIPQELDQYTYLWLRQERCPNGGGMCDVLQRRPRQRGVGYANQLVWIEQNRLITSRVAYFDRSGKMFKVVDNSNFKKFKGRFWYALRTQVTNNRSGGRTIVERRNHRFDNVPNTFFESANFYL